MFMKNGFDFIKEAEKLGVKVTDSQLDSFSLYGKMMLEYNKNVNLTSITEPEEIKEKHFLDSITLISSGKIFEGASLIDIGAGAGFPSVPSKIVREDIHLTMLDSLNKRVKFLSDCIEALDFKNTVALHMRAENGAREKNLREKFDIATARAVASLNVLSEYALPFVKIGGYFIALKSGDIDLELESAKSAIKKLGGKTESVKKLTLPSGFERSIVIIKKLSPTPSIYPRKEGKPAKSPLK